MADLRWLKAENFSGIPFQKPRTLPFEGKSMLLHGENGAGKSSFTRSLEWLVHGRLMHFPGKSGGGPDHRHRNFDHENHPATVQVELMDGGAVARTDGADPTIAGSGSDWLAAMRCQPSILRRKELTRFIDEKPGARFEVVESWLALGAVEKSFFAVKEAHEACAKDAANQATTVQALEASIGSALGCPCPTDWKGIQDTIRAELEALGIAVPGSPADIAVTRAAVAAKAPKVLGAEAMAARQALDRWSTGLPSALASAKAARDEAAARLASAQGKCAPGAGREREIIDAARALLSEHPRDSCPVCTQAISASQVLEGLTARGIALEELRSVSAAAALAAENLRRACASEIANLAGTKWPFDNPGPYLGFVEAAKKTVISLQEGHAVVPPEAEALKTLAEAFDSGAESLRQQGSESAHSTIAKLEALESWPALVTARTAAVASAKAAADAKSLYHAAQKARFDLIQKRLRDVVTPIQAFYSQVHPGEGVEDIELRMPPPTEGGRRDTQAEIYVKFTGQRPEHPLVHLSEGHLDTLGLAFFLMNLKRDVESHTHQRPLVVLDDVISSVDAPHRARVAETLMREFKGWQILVTTHDRAWARKLRAIARRTGFPLVSRAIRKWTRHEGPDIREHRELHEDLRRRIADGDTAQAIAATAGVLLEETLNEARKEFGLPVPGAPDDRWELNSLWDSVQKRLRLAPTQDGCLLPGWFAANQATFDDLTATLKDDNIRNALGAHNNEAADDLSDSDADRLGNAVLRLYEAFYDTAECQSPVRPLQRNKSPAACGCGKLQYPPVEIVTTTAPVPGP